MARGTRQAARQRGPITNVSCSACSALSQKLAEATTLKAAQFTWQAGQRCVCVMFHFRCEQIRMLARRTITKTMPTRLGGLGRIRRLAAMAAANVVSISISVPVETSTHTVLCQSVKLGSSSSDSRKTRANCHSVSWCCCCCCGFCSATSSSSACASSYSFSLLASCAGRPR